ncbi:hypothetical protein T265_06610 [Opisthorchis viverrini]|uniref:Uncharacterized protein n=1 Tax=Opisthorchis viverrini TaxID=6198 RepID=A0A074ZFM4_OPIVI|nr:hypothetical protein T265_06610 [Opisthorchis viverrini]KER26081.1 hypothetical protein T265_06610 [Opisthorchis viverrini]
MKEITIPSPIVNRMFILSGSSSLYVFATSLHEGEQIETSGALTIALLRPTDAPYSAIQRATTPIGGPLMLCRGQHLTSDKQNLERMENCTLASTSCKQLSCFGCWSVRRAWQLDCKRFITNRGDIVSAGLSGFLTVSGSCPAQRTSQRPSTLPELPTFSSIEIGLLFFSSSALPGFGLRTPDMQDERVTTAPPNKKEVGVRLVKSNDDSVQHALVDWW